MTDDYKTKENKRNREMTNTHKTQTCTSRKTQRLEIEEAEIRIEITG